MPALSKIAYHLRYVEIPVSIKLKTDQFHRTPILGSVWFVNHDKHRIKRRQ